MLVRKKRRRVKIKIFLFFSSFIHYFIRGEEMDMMKATAKSIVRLLTGTPIVPILGVVIGCDYDCGGEETGILSFDFDRDGVSVKELKEVSDGHFGRSSHKVVKRDSGLSPVAIEPSSVWRLAIMGVAKHSKLLHGPAGFTDSRWSHDKMYSGRDGSLALKETSKESNSSGVPDDSFGYIVRNAFDRTGATSLNNSG